MNLVKEKIQNLTKKNLDLNKELENLKITSNMGDRAMTPRPDFFKLKEEHRITEEIGFENLSKEEFSTRDVIDMCFLKLAANKRKFKIKLPGVRRASTKNFSSPSTAKLEIRRSEFAFTAIKDFQLPDDIIQKMKKTKKEVKDTLDDL